MSDLSRQNRSPRRQARQLATARVARATPRGPLLAWSAALWGVVLWGMLLGLAGCGVPAGQVAVPIAVADAATVPVLGRSIGDTVYSAASGRDCSVVRLDKGQSYCKPQEPPPSPQTFCTRSLGVVDCWKNPQDLNGGPPRSVADGPSKLTPAQEADRTARWPNL